MQDRDLTGANMKDLVRRYLGYRFLKAGNDQNAKTDVARTIRNFEKEFASVDDYGRISRGQLADILLRAKGVSMTVTPERGFTDEAGNWKNAVATMRTVFDFKWKDQYGAHYFQPDKTVTIGEALYLAEKIGW